jgi:phosphate transport system protein
MERRHLDHDLETLRENLLKMGGEVESMVARAIQALLDRNDIEAQAVRDQDRRVDRLEKQIDEQCSRLLALQQPTAVDLRFILSVMKIVNDLERIGDSAENIAVSVLQLNQEPPMKPYIDIPRMAEITQSMVRDALDSFVERDGALARGVCGRDQEIDNLYEQLFRELLTFMIDNPRNVRRALHILLIAQNLERIADHATNVGEDVVYYLEGKDIRHPADGSERDEDRVPDPART